MKKRIILFAPSISCGGAERVARLLASGLKELGHIPYLVVASSKAELQAHTTNGIEIINLNCKKPIRGTRQLAEVVKSRAPNALIAFGISSGIAASISRTRYRWRAPILIRNENNVEAEWQGADPVNRLIGPTLSRWAARRSKIVAVSESMAAPTARYLKCRQENVTSIPNPVFQDLDTCKEATNDLHPWLIDKKIPTFVAMGRLEYQKGFDILIDAFKLTRINHDARLIIFGNGNLRDELQLKIENLGLSGHIDMPGFTEAPMRQMRMASAFVLSSRFEGFGLVLVEALATGTPVVATDCKYGPSEILESGRYGTLVPVDNPAAMAYALTQVIIGSAAKKSPPKDWFKKFTAIEAAERHLELIP